MSDPFSILTALNAHKSTHHCGPQTVHMDGGASYAAGQLRNGFAHHGEVGTTFTPGQMQSLMHASEAVLRQVTPATQRHK